MKASAMRDRLFFSCLLGNNQLTSLLAAAAHSYFCYKEKYNFRLHFPFSSIRGNHAMSKSEVRHDLK
jgi:hypothetical protein